LISLFRLKKSPRLNAPLLFVSAAALLWALCAGTQTYPSPVHGAEDSAYVDQVYWDPSEDAFYVYMSGEALPKTEAIDASFSEASSKKIPLSATGNWKKFDPNEGVFYIFLVDKSRPDEIHEGTQPWKLQNEAIRKALTAFVGEKNTKDKIGLIAFGVQPADPPTVLLNGTDEGTATIHAKIQQLAYGEGETPASPADFAAAIRKALDLSRQSKEDGFPTRRVAVIFSPNSGFSEGNEAVKAGIREEIQASGLALYGFGFEYQDGRHNQLPSSETNLRYFREFIGNIQIFGEGESFWDGNTSTDFTGDTLKSFRGYVQAFSVLTLTPKSNPLGSPTSLPADGTLRMAWADGKKPAEFGIRYQSQAGASIEKADSSAEISTIAEAATEPEGSPSSSFSLGGPPLPSARLIILAVILVPGITVLILCLFWRFRDIAAAKNGRRPGADIPGSLSRAVSLIVTDERGETQRVNMKISGSLSVGRDPANYLSFPDREMSPRHFSLILENGGFYIQDLRSANGTYVNGAPVEDRAFLRHNDVITAGQRKFVFKCDE
jgi:hypothetical protein